MQFMVDKFLANQKKTSFYVVEILNYFVEEIFVFKEMKTGGTFNDTCTFRYSK